MILSLLFAVCLVSGLLALGRFLNFSRKVAGTQHTRLNLDSSPPGIAPYQGRPYVGRRTFELSANDVRADKGMRRPCPLARTFGLSNLSHLASPEFLFEARGCAAPLV